MTRPLVVKFGGDALATPERIAAAARRIALRRRTAPVVAVASARRGVTDHLLGLVEQVRDASGPGPTTSPRMRAAADRAVASGELVAASLLAVALGGLGVAAEVLDARQAGLESDGHAGGAALVRLRPERVDRLLARGVVPVVTGFQGWHRGRLTTLGRGGSDITAVALAHALAAEGCELVKDPGALHTADPRLVPDARPIARTTHRFLTEIALAGASIIQHHAAERAERDGVPLRFTSVHGDGDPSTVVSGLAAAIGTAPEHPCPACPTDGRSSHAVVLSGGYRGLEPAGGDPAAVSTVAVVTSQADAPDVRAAARAAAASAARSGAAPIRGAHRPHVLNFLVAEAHAAELLRTIHGRLVAALDDGVERRSVYGGR